MTTPPASYRQRLELLAAEGVEPHLDAWAARQLLDRTGPWRRVYGKLRPRRSPWALLVYDAPGVPTLQVRLLERFDGASTHPELDGVDAGTLGRVEIGRCATDPALPGLRKVLASLADPRVVRYHPGDRCTVRGELGPDARFVKVFRDDVDDQREAEERWAATQSDVLSFAVAEPHGWDEHTRSSWYGVVPGDPLEHRLGEPDAADLCHRVGAALGQLAVSPLRPRRTADAASQLARAQRGLARASAAVSDLTDDLDRAFEALTRAHERLMPRPLVPIHGAAHLGQWVVDESGRLGLVDFDRFALGEPEFDLATFFVELRAFLNPPRAAELEDAVLDGFLAGGGRVDRPRLAVYLVHKRLARAARAAAGLSPDGEERARMLLDDLAAPLRELAER